METQEFIARCERLKTSLDKQIAIRDKRKMPIEPTKPSRLIPGRKYIKLDIGHAACAMIEIKTGIVYGIKGYGRVNKKKCYGDLLSVTGLKLLKVFWGSYF